ncbi:MAG: elongation factor P maturation arginine rhamnosyltransferase EarP [Aquabacterium sp.]
MLWDVFCRVIDNFGDIGVCWRLAADLGQRGEQVRLWVDDPRALAWMAPGLHWGPDADTGLEIALGQPGVQVLHWRDAEIGSERDAGKVPGWLAGDVVVEAFGCDPPAAFIERMQARARQGLPMQWVNLEYLSAEAYVERSHGLRSPVWAGAGSGLSKRFFYPGFAPATGGLLREVDLLARRQAEVGTPEARAAFLRQVIGKDIAPSRPIVLIFCYDSAPLGELLDRLSARADAPHVLLTPGPATRLARAWRDAHPGARLACHELPHLSQDDFDQLLWCADLNLVRGEDSAVRALWAARPHIWHIYEQDDGVHAAKLEAFMNRWMDHWPADLKAEIAAWWRAWNRLGPMPEHLPAFTPADSAWGRNSVLSRANLLAQRDLCSQLLDFVTSSG